MVRKILAFWNSCKLFAIAARHALLSHCSLIRFSRRKSTSQFAALFPTSRHFKVLLWWWIPPTTMKGSQSASGFQSGLAPERDNRLPFAVSTFSWTASNANYDTVAVWLTLSEPASSGMIGLWINLCRLWKTRSREDGKTFGHQT